MSIPWYISHQMNENMKIQLNYSQKKPCFDIEITNYVFGWKSSSRRQTPATQKKPKIGSKKVLVYFENFFLPILGIKQGTLSNANVYGGSTLKRIEGKTASLGRFSSLCACGKVNNHFNIEL